MLAPCKYPTRCAIVEIAIRHYGDAVRERAWLVRDAVARILADAPLPAATWLSVARRSLIVVACFGIGALTGDLHAGVLAAFGALQVALVETAIPLRSLLRLLLLLAIACVASVFLAQVLGGSWWGLLAIAALAYVFGATGGLTPAAMTIGISSLALAVIFAGMPATSVGSALQGAGFVAVGIVLQSAAWIAAWRPERDRFIGHALANKLRTDVRLLRRPAIDVAGLVKTHAQVDIAHDAIASAQLLPDVDLRARQVLSATVVMTRAIIAWLVLDAPSEAARIAVGVRLQDEIAQLERRRAARSEPRSASPSATPAIDDALARLRSAIDALRGAAVPSAAPMVASARQRPPTQPATLRDFWHALWPGRISRHGVRMAVGVGVAEILAMELPIAHSFWLPLTVVFTLRPDWSFTIIRGFTRTLGNLAAVVVLPAVLIALNHNDVATAIALAVLSAITFRTFFGNYAIASFGLAGTVLLLDSTMMSGDELFVVRIVAAILGSLIAAAVAFAIPTWSSTSAPDQVGQLAAVLGRWRRLVDDNLSRRTGVDADALDECNFEARRDLVALDQTSTGALLEPRRSPRAIDGALVTAAGIHEVAALVAVSTVLMTTPPVGDEAVADLVTRSRLTVTDRAFNDAVTAFQRP